MYQSDIVGTIIADLSAEKFYGTLELKMENGTVVLIRKEQTIKPDTYRSTRETAGNLKGHTDEKAVRSACAGR